MDSLLVFDTLSAGAISQPNICNESFMAAIRDHNINALALALNDGADVNMEEGWALRNACSLGRLDIVKFLIGYGANVHVNEDAALRTAVCIGDLDIVQFLVANGADIHVHNDESLIISIWNNFTPIAEFLIKSGANIQAAIDDHSITDIWHLMSFADRLNYAQTKIARAWRRHVAKKTKTMCIRIMYAPWM